ncbi:MAG TPA: hypothetical protein VJR89_36890, partial [Polyangiales bacterium]|nr:hypothetical protein [Polyangiales bacterium]
TLPAQFDSNELPNSVAEALRARVASLPDAARALGCAFALCSDESFSFDECASLHGTHRIAALQADLDALIRLEIVRYLDGKFGLTHASWVSPLMAALSPELARTLDRRLAQVFEARGDCEFLAAQHWLRAGKLTHGLDVLIRYAEHVARDAPPLTLTSARGFHRPARDWRETYELGLRACEQLDRPRRERYVLRQRMTALCSLLGQHDAVELPLLVAELAECSGLSDYAALDASLPHGERLRIAFSAAQQRYEAANEHDRLLDPRAALRELTRALTVTSGLAAQAWDLAYLRAAPDITPFQGLAPSIATMNMLLRGMERRLTGSLEQASAIYRELLVRLEQPDHGGLDASNAGYTQAGIVNMLGLIEAGSGLASCVSRIEALQKLPAFAVNALLLCMLHAMFQGDAEGADAYRGQAARVRVQTGGRPIYGSLHLIWELQAHAICDDLTRMRHTLEEIAPLAARFVGWQPIFRYGSAEYHRMRRSPDRALLEIEAALQAAPPGAHQVWPLVAVCHVLVLHDLGRHAEALARARENLEDAQLELGEVPAPLQLASSLAEAQVAADGADTELAAQAEQRADAAIAQLSAAGVSGIHIGFAHELRARIAALLDDASSFERHAGLCRGVYMAHKHPALAAKYERLFQAAAEPVSVPELPDASVEGRIVAALERCRTAQQRAQLALTALLQHTGSSAGVLYRCGPEALECVAQIGEVGDAAALAACVRGYVSLQLTAADATLTGEAAKTTAAM